MEKIKSNLQKSLEAQGWEFLTNTDPTVETVYHPVEVQKTVVKDGKKQTHSKGD